MPHFSDILRVAPLPDGRTWVLLTRFGFGGDTAPAGFMTDFASIPRLFQNILPGWGTYGRGAVIHDWLYWSQYKTRREADGVLFSAMMAGGTGWITRWTIYLVLRPFGFVAWHRNRIEREEGHSRQMNINHLSLETRSGRVSFTRHLARRAFRRIKGE